MAYNKEQDIALAEETVKLGMAGESAVLKIGLYQYNGGSAKIGIVRVMTNEKGTTYRPSGRMTPVEFHVAWTTANKLISQNEAAIAKTIGLPKL